VNPLREIGSVKWFRRMRQTAHSKYISSEEESQKTTEIAYLFRRFRKVESRSNSPARRDLSLEAGEAGFIKMEDVVRIFKIGGIDCLTPDHIASLFDPDQHTTIPIKMNPNLMLTFQEFRDALCSESTNSRFRDIIRNVRKRIVQTKLETVEDLIYLPMTLRKMINYLYERC
jgi:hypothetical protein